MTFFDEIGRTLADRGMEAAQRAKGVAEVLQMKGQISAENSKVKELYGAIGALYFKKHREDPDDEYQMFFPEIEETLVHIAELEARVREVEGTYCCGSCGSPLRKDDMFCSKCGMPVAKEEEFSQEEETTSAVVSASEGVEKETDDIFVNEDSE